MMNLDCQYFGKCGGCSSQTANYEQHLQSKINRFIDSYRSIIKSQAPEIKTVTLESLKYRTRADLTVLNGQIIGFFEKESNRLIDIKECQLFSEDLLECFVNLRKCLPPIQKGSVRIRVSPTGNKGIWLDFSNLDIKQLLEEKSYLKKLASIFDVIEIGQKKKILDPINIKLTDPKRYNWFETYSNNRSIPLPMHIGSFSQTGFISNKLLIEELEQILNSLPRDLNWFEGCCGSGNLTFPLIRFANKVYATEFDSDSLQSLNETISTYTELSKKISFHRLNIHKPNEQLVKLISDCDAILMDPPRSGLQDFPQVFTNTQKRPKYFIYVSCFADSLLKDINILKELGFIPKKITCVDQFPFSDHAEFICLFER